MRRRLALGVVPLLAALGATIAPSAGAAVSPRALLPAAYAAAPVTYTDAFSSLSGWNPYITSRAAQGWPWNSNGADGSSPASPAQDYDAEYDLPGELRTGSGLVIRARRAPVRGVLGSAPATYSWRAGAVSSYGHFQFTGGYLQIVAKLPTAPGLWPALWMLPGNDGPGSDNYEIDLFEGGMLGGAPPSEAFSWHLHTPGGVFGGDVSTGVRVSSGYHTYGLAWVPGQSITWYFDGREMARLTSAQASIPTEPMELIMSLEVANAATAGWHTLPRPTLARGLMRVRSVEVFGLPR